MTEHPTPSGAQEPKCPTCGEGRYDEDGFCSNALHVEPWTEACGCVRKPGRWGSHLVSACPMHENLLRKPKRASGAQADERARLVEEALRKMLHAYEHGATGTYRQELVEEAKRALSAPAETGESEREALRDMVADKLERLAENIDPNVWADDRRLQVSMCIDALSGELVRRYLPRAERAEAAGAREALREMLARLEETHGARLWEEPPSRDLFDAAQKAHRILAALAAAPQQEGERAPWPTQHVPSQEVQDYMDAELRRSMEDERAE